MTAAAAPSTAIRPKLQTLTSLRFFAALHVVLFHMRVTGILSGGPWWYQNFASIGYIGVNFFFVLSGFILVYTYSGSPLNPWRFWQARFARIYPAYVVSLVAAAPFFFFAVHKLDLPIFVWSKHHLPAACLLTVALLQSWVPSAALTWNSVCWSLSVEAFSYAVFPLLMRWSDDLRQRRLLLLIAAVSSFALAVSCLYLFLHPDGIGKISSGDTTLFWKNILSFNPLARLPEFMVGVFAGRLFLERNSPRGEAHSSDERRAAPLVIAGLMVIGAITVLLGRMPRPLMSAGILSLAFAVIIYGFALQPNWARVLQVRPLILLGDASYSLYLLHSIVITRAFDAVPALPYWLRVCAAIGAAFAASLMSYLIVEEPARRLLRPRKPSSGARRLSLQSDIPAIHQPETDAAHP